ncbi:unnamed protein product [Closterium sp. Yama58-4]|nr:unnamed protein product [Closterium sp. Yama58-4]
MAMLRYRSSVHSGAPSVGPISRFSQFFLFVIFVFLTGALRADNDRQISLSEAATYARDSSTAARPSINSLAFSGSASATFAAKAGGDLRKESRTDGSLHIHGPMELPPGSRSEVKITVGGVELGMEDDTWSYLRDAIGSDIIVKPGGTEEVLVIEAVHGDVGRLSLSIFLKVEAHADCDCEYLLLPIDLTTSPGGVVSMADEIDFGTLTSARDTVIRHVELGNVGSTMATVEDVRLATAQSSPSLVEVPFKARIVLGSVTVEPVENTVFFFAAAPEKEKQPAGEISGQPGGENIGFVRSAVTKELVLRNKFSCPVLVYDAFFSHDCIQAKDFPSSLLPPGGISKPFLLQLNPEKLPLSLTIVNFTIATNVSDMVVPLHVLPGLLELDVPRNISFRLANPGPFPIAIMSASCSSRHVTVHVSDVIHMEEREARRAPVPVALSSALPSSQHHIFHLPIRLHLQTLASIPEFHTAEVTVKFVPVTEGAGSELLVLETKHQLVKLDLKYASFRGEIAVSPKLPLVFPSLFPGKAHRIKLSANSTFPHPLVVTGIRVSDSRVSADLKGTVLGPSNETELGDLVFSMPLRETFVTASGGASNGSESWGRMLERLQDGGRRSPGGDNNEGRDPWGEGVTKEERETAQGRLDEWTRVVRAGENVIVSSLVLETEVMESEHVEVKGVLAKPRVVSEASSSLQFGRVQVGTAAGEMVLVQNPSDYPVRVRLVMDEPSGFRVCGNGNGGNGNASHLSVPWLGFGAPWLGLGVRKESEEGGAGFTLAPDAVTDLILPPGWEGRLGPVVFRPDAVGCVYNGSVYVRNNLTLLEEVRMVGEGGSGVLHVIGSRGPEMLLMVNVTEEHVLVKERRGRRLVGAAGGAYPRFYVTEVESSVGKVKWPVVAERKFKLVNRGDLPLKITSTSLHGAKSKVVCSLRGFSIHPCEPFTLAPGQSNPLLLSFTPDLTSTVVRAVLHIESSAGAHELPIRGYIPRNLAVIAIDAEPRHPMDSVMKAVVASMLVAMFGLLVRAAVSQLTLFPSPWFPGFSAAAAAALTRRLQKKQNALLLANQLHGSAAGGGGGGAPGGGGGAGGAGGVGLVGGVGVGGVGGGGFAADAETRARVVRVRVSVAPISAGRGQGGEAGGGVSGVVGMHVGKGHDGPMGDSGPSWVVTRVEKVTDGADGEDDGVTDAEIGLGLETVLAVRKQHMEQQQQQQQQQQQAGLSSQQASRAVLVAPQAVEQGKKHTGQKSDSAGGQMASQQQPEQQQQQQQQQVCVDRGAGKSDVLIASEATVAAVAVAAGKAARKSADLGTAGAFAPGAGSTGGGVAVAGGG